MQSIEKGLKMLLTYGNIKKSKFLKYIYLSDYNDDEYRKALLEYNKSIIKNFEKSDFIKIYKYLHDAKIYLKQTNGNVVIKVKTYDSEEKKLVYFDIIFEKAKILSWNTVKETGHISRLNKKYKPREYGYEEFYEDNGKKYVTLILFGNKVRKGLYYPMVTLNYENLRINRYKREIHCFDKTTGNLIGTEDIEIDFLKLEFIFSDVIKDDPDLIYEYKITKENMNKFKTGTTFEFDKFNYFLSYISII